MRRALPMVAVALAAGCGATHPVAEHVGETLTPATIAPATISPATTSMSSSPPPTPSTVPSTHATTPAPVAPTVSSASRPAVAPLPAFRVAETTVTAAALGATYHAGCPTTPDRLRLLTMSFVDFSGRAETGEMVVEAAQVAHVEHVFAALYAERFPIRRMVPVSAYGGSDDASVAADNTAGFNCRAAVTASGATSWSMHAYGDAIDVDPVENPYIYGGTVDPPGGAAYIDRADHRPGMAYLGSPLNTAFADVGWRWGASFDDYQHFSTNGK